MTDPDILLFGQLKKGNRKAFDALFLKYYKPLCHFSFYFLHSREDAEEVVQSLFIKLWENAATMDISTSLKSYLYRACRNMSCNLIRSNAIRQQNEEKFHELLQVHTHDSAYPEELIRHLHQAIETLPVKCRNIFILSKMEGLTYEEIADYLELSEKTIENQMIIAFKKLREILHPMLKKILAIN